ncbi:hypothetical protein F5Y04DRAFT_259202 [Hypomontagnella monticulosa]|nr:hypothetical protein F5Y04DRAFT_259202 [Hypomontagnella monticulosa]
MLTSRLPSICIGTDICQISRISHILLSTSGTRFVRRILTPKELRVPRTRSILQAFLHFQKGDEVKGLRQGSKRFRELHKNPKFKRAAEFMAGRFAAKEATIKAFTSRKLSFYDIIITYEHCLAAADNKGIPLSVSIEQDGASLPSSAVEEDDASSPSPPLAGLDQTSSPVAVIGGQVDVADHFARLSISHDGDYAIATCLVDPSESIVAGKKR